MPIRVEDIPNFQPTRLNQATMDTRIAGAPGHALEGVARDIASVSKPFADIANRLQDVKNADTEMRIRTAWDQAQTALWKHVAENPGADIFQGIDKLAKESAAMLEARGVPPEVRDRLRTDQQRMVHGARIRGAEQSSHQIMKDGRAAFRQRVDLAVDNGDAAAAAREVERAGESGLLTGTQGQQEMAKVEKTIHHRQQLRAAREDPNRFLAEVQATEHLPQEDPGQRRELVAEARKAGIGMVAERGQTYRDEWTRGNVNRPEDIDALMPRLTDGQKAPYKAHLALRGAMDRDPAVRKRMASPETQHELVGRADALLADFDAEDADAPEKLAQLQTVMNLIHPADGAQARLQTSWQRILNHQLPLTGDTLEEKKITRLSRTTRDELAAVREHALVKSASRRKGAAPSPGGTAPAGLTAEEEDGMLSRQQAILRDHGEVMEAVDEVLRFHKGARDDAFQEKLDRRISEVRDRQLVRRSREAGNPDTAPPWHAVPDKVKLPPAFATDAVSSHFSGHRQQVERTLSRHGLHFTPHQVDALASFQEDTGALDQLLSPDGKTFRTPADVAAAIVRYRNTGGQRDPVKEIRRRQEQSLFHHGR